MSIVTTEPVRHLLTAAEWGDIAASFRLAWARLRDTLKKIHAPCGGGQAPCIAQGWETLSRLEGVGAMLYSLAKRHYPGGEHDHWRMLFFAGRQQESFEEMMRWGTAAPRPLSIEEWRRVGAALLTIRDYLSRVAARIEGASAVREDVRLEVSRASEMGLFRTMLYGLATSQHPDWDGASEALYGEELV